MVTEINNLHGWKRTWNNSGVTGKQTLSAAMTSLPARRRPLGFVCHAFISKWMRDEQTPNDNDNINNNNKLLLKWLYRGSTWGI